MNRATPSETSGTSFPTGCAGSRERGAGLEATECPLCRRRDGPVRFREGMWCYRRCGCGLLRLDPRPSVEALDAFYQSYLPSDAEGVNAWERLMAPVFIRHREWLSALRPPGRLLDVGCGYGFFLREMASAGWRVQGVDLSHAAVGHAQGLGLNVAQGGIEDSRWDEARFDLITAFYVIEHHPAPRSFIRRAWSLLSPDGLLLLRWPNTTPLARVIHPWLGDRLRLFQAPAHLFDFSPRTMGRLLAEERFRLLDTRHAGATRPASLAGRWVSRFGTGVSEVLRWLTGGRHLLPGVSRSTLSQRVP